MGQRDDLDVGPIHGPWVIHSKQDGFAAGENLRGMQAEFVVSSFSDGPGRASARRKPQALLLRSREDAAILAPTRALEAGELSEEDNGAAFHGNLVHLAT